MLPRYHQIQAISAATSPGLYLSLYRHRDAFIDTGFFSLIINIFGAVRAAFHTAPLQPGTEQPLGAYLDRTDRALLNIVYNAAAKLEIGDSLNRYLQDSTQDQCDRCISFRLTKRF